MGTKSVGKVATFSLSAEELENIRKQAVMEYLDRQRPTRDDMVMSLIDHLRDFNKRQLLLNNIIRDVPRWTGDIIARLNKVDASFSITQIDDGKAYTEYMSSAREPVILNITYSPTVVKKVQGKEKETRATARDLAESVGFHSFKHLGNFRLMFELEQITVCMWSCRRMVDKKTVEYIVFTIGPLQVIMAQ